MSFADSWNTLQTKLSVGAKIPNWTAHKGEIGDAFSIASIEPDAIVVDTPGAKRLQIVPATDFEEVYELWNDYRHRKLERSAFTPLTRYSKYVISILHWLEVSCSGHLP